MLIYFWHVVMDCTLFRPRLHWNMWVASNVIWNKFHASHWNSFLPLPNVWHETYFKWHLMPPTRFNVTEASSLTTSCSIAWGRRDAWNFPTFLFQPLNFYIFSNFTIFFSKIDTLSWHKFKTGKYPGKSWVSIGESLSHFQSFCKHWVERNIKPFSH